VKQRVNSGVHYYYYYYYYYYIFRSVTFRSLKSPRRGTGRAGLPEAYYPLIDTCDGGVGPQSKAGPRHLPRPQNVNKPPSSISSAQRRCFAQPVARQRDVQGATVLPFRLVSMDPLRGGLQRCQIDPGGQRVVQAPSAWPSQRERDGMMSKETGFCC